MSTEGTVLHAYGVVRADSQVVLPRGGINGSRVQLATSGTIAALVSRLEAARYGEAVWREHAEDPDWLAAFATEHQEVLGAVAATCDVLPFRIPGMYADEASLLGVLGAEQDVLGRGLRAILGHVEWGVQVFWDGAPEQEPAPAPASGKDYLRHRSEEAGSRERAGELRREQVLAAYGRISDAATHSVTNPPQDPALSKRREPMLLNSAHLVLRDHEERFIAVLHDVHEQLRPHGLAVEVSGPWPPYNFVHLGTEELHAP